MCLLCYLSGVDEIFVLTGMWHSATGCFVADVSTLQSCMSTEIFFFLDFMFDFISSVDVNWCFLWCGYRKMLLYGPIIYQCWQSVLQERHVPSVSNWTRFPHDYKITIHHLCLYFAAFPRSCLVYFSYLKLFSCVSIPEQEKRLVTWPPRRDGWLHTIN
jgi:hypothetical protein